MEIQNPLTVVNPDLEAVDFRLYFNFASSYTHSQTEPAPEHTIISVIFYMPTHPSEILWIIFTH